ncbi:MAG: ExbD/TolR family transport energizing protein [Myxococcaceae bacterium]|nr:ExbD/TolR family transport energizing protein [Myxococcaceae bacterium]
MAGGNQPRGGIIEGINVTPLVDIVLVLLIIFIVTAKMVVAPSVPLDLPAATHGEEVQTIFSVAIPKSGELLIDGEPASDASLHERAKRALAKDKELRAVIQADGDVPHRRVIDVLDRLKSAGLTRVAFGSTKRPEQTAPQAAQVPAP